MAVHFMFAASKQFECVPVEGDSIELGRLKDEIFNLKFRKAMEKRRVKERFHGSMEEILGARTRVPRHSRVVVKRLPAYVVSETEKQQQAIHSTRVQEIINPAARPIDDGFGDDVFSTRATSRSESGATVVSTLAASSNRSESSPNSEINRNRSESCPHSEIIKAVRVAFETRVVRSTALIPRDLECVVCHEIMKDAVLIPCCCTSFCRACVTKALCVHQKCPSCASCRCTPSNLLTNRSLNASVALFLKANGTVLTSSQAISNTSSQSLSAQSGLSSEHKRSESTNITAEPHLTTSCVAAKRKSAPLSISLANAKRSKPLIISLATQAKLVT